MTDQMPPAAEEPKKSNTALIIAIVAVVLCCCCIGAIGGYYGIRWLWINGDSLFGTGALILLAFS